MNESAKRPCPSGEDETLSTKRQRQASEPDSPRQGEKQNRSEAEPNLITALSEHFEEIGLAYLIEEYVGTTQALHGYFEKRTAEECLVYAPHWFPLLVENCRQWLLAHQQTDLSLSVTKQSRDRVQLVGRPVMIKITLIFSPPKEDRTLLLLFVTISITRNDLRISKEDKYGLRHEAYDSRSEEHHALAQLFATSSVRHLAKLDQTILFSTDSSRGVIWNEDAARDFFPTLARQGLWIFPPNSIHEQNYDYTGNITIGRITYQNTVQIRGYSSWLSE